VIKTLCPVIFNSYTLPGLLPHDPPHFVIAAYTVYSGAAGKKVADTTDKSFSEALRPDAVELTTSILTGSFFRHTSQQYAHHIKENPA
jgi:hypothetical protein